MSRRDDDVQVSVGQQIRANWEAFQNDPERQAAVAKLDRPAANAEFAKCREHATTLFNFDNYKTSLQQLKAQQSSLDPQTERAYAARFDEALGAYKNVVSSAKSMAKMGAASGLDKVFERHSQKLFWQLPLNPYAPQLSAMLKTMGMNESDIAQHAAALKAGNWDILHLHGGAGTLQDLADRAEKKIPAFERQLAAVKLHGLPVIDGNNNDLSFLVAALIVMVVVVVFFIPDPVFVAIAIGAALLI